MNRNRLLWAIPFAMTLSFASPQSSAFGKNVVLHGVPIVQTRSSMEHSHNVKLDNNQKITNTIIITKRDDRYFWETRDNRELIFRSMRHFDLFIDPATGGYIKVIKKGDKFGYIEHISIKRMKAFTYWGNVIRYNTEGSE